MALLIKIFYNVYLFFKASETHANSWKTLDGKFREFACIVPTFAKETKEAPLFLGLGPLGSVLWSRMVGDFNTSLTQNCVPLKKV